MMSLFFEDLPAPWQTVCAKGHADSEDHNRRCYNWISPNGRKYKDWSEVQGYFQLLNFEDDIPGIACKPENVKRKLGEVDDEGVTLEEDIKKDDKNSKDTKASAAKRRRSTVSKNEDGKTDTTKKKGRKKKDEGDEDQVKGSKAPTPKMKESPVKEEIKTEPNILDQAVKEATLDEMSDDVVVADPVGSNHKIPEGLKIVNVDEPSSVKVETKTPGSLTKTPGSLTKTPGSLTKATITPVVASESSVESPGSGAVGVKTGARIRPMTTTQQRPGTPGASVRMMTRPTTPAPRPRPASSATVRPSTPAARATTPASVRSSTPAARASTPAVVRPSTPAARATPPVPRQQTPVTRSATPQQVRAQRSATPQQQQRPQQQQSRPGIVELPGHLRAHVKFQCKLETNSEGGGSLYRVAAGHVGQGSGDGWLMLRRYCHSKLIEWWQWYQPYYTFPIQVKITSQTKTMTKRIPSSSEFVKWLRSEESLQSYYLSECELYCLANILGSTINLMTFSSNNRSDAKWESFEPHQGLIHQNKFANNKAPLYCIHELGVQFSRLVKKQ